MLGLRLLGSAVSESALDETLIDAKGDLIVGSAADTAIRKAVGANDTVLTADSAQAGGVKWAAPAASPLWTPQMNGLLTASLDPAAATTQLNLSAAYITTVRLPVPAAITVTNLLVLIMGGSGTLTTALGLLYKLDGTLIAKTASQVTPWASAGLKTMALTAEAGQSLALPAADVIVGLFCEGGAPTAKCGPTGDSLIINAGLSSPAYRAGYVDPAGSGTAPNPITGVTADGKLVWAALS